MKQLHQKVESDLTKLRATITNDKKDRDATVSEWTHISSKVEVLTGEIQMLESEGFKQMVLGKAQKEYMNHLTFLLNPLMGKLRQEVVVEIRALL